MFKFYSKMYSLSIIFIQVIIDLLFHNQYSQQYLLVEPKLMVNLFP